MDTDPWTLSNVKRHFTIFVPGAQYSKMFRNYIKSMRGEATSGRIWDGNICFISRNQYLPIGLLQELIEFSNLNNVLLKYKNKRTSLTVKNPDVNENFLKGIKLRDYQIEATAKIAEQGFGIIKIATGGGKCVSANTNITFRVKWAAKEHSVEKTLTMKEFYYNYTYFKRNNSALRGYKFEVLTDSGFKEVEDAFIVKDQDMYEVELEDGKRLVCSSDHRVKTKNGYTHVKDLKVGDAVQVK